jgi:hypothetical protein
MLSKRELVMLGAVMALSVAFGFVVTMLLTR